MSTSLVVVSHTSFCVEFAGITRLNDFDQNQDNHTEIEGRFGHGHHFVTKEFQRQ